MENRFIQYIFNIYTLGNLMIKIKIKGTKF